MEGPPTKIAAVGYRYCPHCGQTVSKRTYRKHVSLPVFDFHLPDTSATSTPDPPDHSAIGDEDDTTEESAMCTTADVDENAEEDQEDHTQQDNFIPDGLEEEDAAFFSDSDSSHKVDYSSSEFEEDEEELSVNAGPVVERNEQAHSLIRWLVIFFCLWQTMFTISDTAVGFVLKFIAAFFQLLATLTSSPLVIAVAAGMPATLYLLKKYVECDTNSFTSFVVCPACYSLYKFEDCFCIDGTGQTIPKKCTQVLFPNHPQRNRRLPCGTPLMKKINMSGGKVKYVPRYTYAYQPVKKSLQRLLHRPGFTEQLEHWRSRKCTEGYMSDVYDGQVWNDFNSDKYSKFLQGRRCYGLMLNFDFFQPYKHSCESYGVLYMTLMNLPREQRFKQENVLLVGIIPAFEHEPTCLNSFLEPLVSELKEFWSPGVRLYSAESPRFKLQFRLALMCVACDIPAARKVCGFMGHSANLGCSRCLKFFPGGFEGKDFSGFDRELWPCRDVSVHKATCQKLKKCRTPTERATLESQTGIKYSILTKLPYFDPIRFTIVDPMHNFFLGTAKYVMKNVWMKNNLVTKEHMNTIQARVDSMIVPSDIGRIPRKIASSFGGFTAEQWKNWVILYSMFALRGILSQEHYLCWQAFVLSCFFLCRREISLVDLKKADLLLLKFCKGVQDLYGHSTVTPNMHLHCHIADCVRDYGSVYGFWLFSFERYNGILGNYPTNKRNTSEQLMRRFIYETECFQLSQPDMFKEHFNKVIPLYRSHYSAAHQHQVVEPLTNSSDLQSVTFPSVSKFRSLNAINYDHLKAVYSCVYDDTTDDEMVRTIRVFKTITLYKQRLGSCKSPSTKHSSYVMASWAESSGSIGTTTSTILRPGKVLFYFTHQHKVNGKHKEHLFAAVYWYAEHLCHSLYGKPLEIWKDSHIPEGPAMFLPIHKLSCRCVIAHGMIPLTGRTEERVLFVSPLPGLKFY